MPIICQTLPSLLMKIKYAFMSGRMFLILVTVQIKLKVTHIMPVIEGVDLCSGELRYIYVNCIICVQEAIAYFKVMT